MVLKNPGNGPSLFFITSLWRFSSPVIFVGNELQNRAKGYMYVPRETEDAEVETLFGSYFYDLLLCVVLHGAWFSPLRALFPSGKYGKLYRLYNTFLIVINFHKISHN